MDVSRCERPRVLFMEQSGVEMLGFSGAWQNWGEASVTSLWVAAQCPSG